MRGFEKKELIETDAYSQEILSKSTINSEVQSGVKAPNTPLTLKMDAEYTRSILSHKYIAGVKIRKRTIALRLDFGDVPMKSIASENCDSTPAIVYGMGQGRIQSANNPTTNYPRGNSVQVDSSESTGPGDLTPGESSTALQNESSFEERLCKWLKDCFQHRGSIFDPEKPDLKNREIIEQDRDQFMV